MTACETCQGQTRNRRWCSVACRREATRVDWACQACPRTERRSRHQAKARVCGVCRYRLRGQQRSYRHTAEINRIRRVMFVHGLKTEAEAKIWLHGWSNGRRAALEAYKRGVKGNARARVGGEAWEQSQRV